MPEPADTGLSDALRELAEGEREHAAEQAPRESHPGDAAAFATTDGAAADPATIPGATGPSTTSTAPPRPRRVGLRIIVIPLCLLVGALNAAIGGWGIGVLTHRIRADADAMQMAIVMTAMCWPIALGLFGAAAFYWRHWRRRL